MSDTLIRDNKNYGSVGEFLKDVIREGSDLSVVSAYFTIFAYYGLHEQLDSIKNMKFLFGEPTFVNTIECDVRNYKIEDNYFSFWYHFLFEKKSFYEILGPEESAKEIMDPQSFFSYFGFVFETIGLEYMIRMAKNRKLPFIPSKYGKWWGNNPARKCQDNIDVLLIDDKNEKYIFCECKFKGESFGKSEMEDMLSRKSIFAHAKETYFYAFSKSGFSDYVKENASSNNITLVTVDDLFEFGE